MPWARKARALDLRRLAVEDLDEHPADGLALGLRVVDARERGEELARRRPRGSAGCCSGRGRGRTTCSASLRRRRPVSTKTQVSWSPIASWISTAATEESTPPERPQITLPVAHLGADAGHRLGAEGGHGPVAAAAGDAVGEVAQDQRAARGVGDLRVELHAVEPPALVGDHRDRASPRRWRRRRSRAGWR